MSSYRIQELQCSRAELRDPSRHCQRPTQREEEERLRASLDSL
jgi:hypothetical protein